MYCLPLQSDLLRTDVGEKALNLSIMSRNNIPIPQGFVVANQAFMEFGAENGNPGQLPASLYAEIEEHLKRLNGQQVMVRSSAIGEDSAEASFAGQLSSFLCDSTVDAVVLNLLRCWASYHTENVRVYQERRNVQLQGMGVIVQELVDPEYAGVLFTRSPDNAEAMLCEYVQEHGEQLVSGAVTPARITCSRTDTVVPSAPFDIGSLISIAYQLESLFNCPLDIEWAVSNGTVWIVQSRPITAGSQPQKQERIYWSNTNVNENYPGPITPLLYSIARDSYYHYFRNLSRLLQISPDSIRRLEPAYTNIIGAFGCRMYYNMTSIHTIISHSPFAGLLRRAFDNFVGYQEGERRSEGGNIHLQRIKFVASFIRLNYSLAANVKRFEQQADIYSSRVSGASTLHELRDCFHGFMEIRLHNWYRASLADFFAMVYHGVLGQFCQRYFGSESQGIHNSIIQAIPGLISSRPVAEIWKIAEMIRSNPKAHTAIEAMSSEEFLKYIRSSDRFSTINNAIEGYLQTWGFRCSGELMLTEESYCDAPEMFIDLLRGYIEQHGEDPDAIIRRKEQERLSLMRELRARLRRRRRYFAPAALLDISLLRLLSRLCFSGIAARERVRLKQAQLYHSFKLTLHRIGAEFVQRGLLESPRDIFFLRYQEIAEHLTTSDMLAGTTRELIALRREEFARTSAQRFPDDFSSIDGIYPFPDQTYGQPAQRENDQILTGLSACGGRVRGRVQLLTSVMEIGRIRQGDILVTRQTDPGWATVFPLISGLIVERGGMLSHGAIVAREFGIPAIIGVANATDLLSDGDEIELNADMGEVRRVVPSHSPDIEVSTCV